MAIEEAPSQTPQAPAPRRRPLRRLLFLISAIVLALFVFAILRVVLLVVLSRAFGTKGIELVTISKETTYITEPLREDGYPDYAAALNERSSAGVTPENNAAVLFWKAVGPNSVKSESKLSPKDRATVFKLLGVPPLPEKGDYLVPFDTYLDARKKGDKPAVGANNEEDRDKTWEWLDRAGRRPWSKDEFPLVAGWLEANEKPLVLVMEASRRPRWFDPIVCPPGKTLRECEAMSLSAYREVARALAAAGMLRAKDGKGDEAWGMLMACHRLARLVGQGPTVLDALVAISIEEMACAGDQALVQQAHLSAAEIARLRDELAELPPMPKMVEKIDTGERFIYLDSVVGMALTIARGESPVPDKPDDRAEPAGMAGSVIGSLKASAMDWDSGLRTGNAWFDVIADACRKPTRVERTEALRKVEAAVNKDMDWKWIALSMLASPRGAISGFMGRSYVSLFFPSVLVATNAEDRATMRFQLTTLAFALAAYHADHGSYPAKLAELAPQYLAAVPEDIFTAGELHYRQEGDGYLLYSVGVNGKDDGGRSQEDRKDNEQWDDLVVRVPAAAEEKPK